MFACAGLIGNYFTYPIGTTFGDTLIADEYTWVTLAYDPGHATSFIENGIWYVLV